MITACTLAPSQAAASICDTPGEDWLMCEDFEGGAAGWADWFQSSSFVECRGCADGVNNPDRLALSNDGDHVFDGEWAMHMPGGAGSGYQGGELIFHTCEGEGRAGCDMTNYEELYLRTRVKLAEDHQYVHHFLSLGGTRPNGYWEGSGNAGCRPNGMRHAGTTLDFNTDHELWFYTYHPSMRCDSGGYCSGSYAADICNGCAERGLPCESGPECCWGNRFAPEPAEVLPRGEWVCLEVMMKINTPGENDGEMAFWMNDELGHREAGMRWRDVEELGLNRANMSHYVARGDSEHSNRISFDDFIVSTSRIGCDMSPPPGRDGGAPGADAGQPETDAAGSDAGSTPRLDAARTDVVGRTDDSGAEGGCSAVSSSAHSLLVILVAAFLVGFRARRRQF